MKLTTSPFKSDVLTLTKSELKRISEGEELHVSALYIRLEEEPKPDRVYYGVFDIEDVQSGKRILDSCFTSMEDAADDIKLTFDGETGKLKSAEVL
jgi:hypothetical protein